MTCPFDKPDLSRVFYESPLILCLWDRFPVSDGHALVITKRHVASWFDTTKEEQSEMLRGIEVAKRAIAARHSPDGFNIGLNIGEAAGQTVKHVHIHIIPRYAGDTVDPRGGVRHVIPEKGNYLAPKQEQKKHGIDLGDSANLSTGPSNPLLPKLLADIDQAERVDIAVAFTQMSGVSIVWPHFEDLLNRGGQLRYLTGDYLNVTDPTSLSRLLDLSGPMELRVFETGGELSFHPKVYIVHLATGGGRAYVGSSNLTRTALQEGVEWNYRIISSDASNDFSSICAEFEKLFSDKRSVLIDEDWVLSYDASREEAPVHPPKEGTFELPETAPSPHGIQEEALKALKEYRAAGNRAGLAVLATGLGKTWLSAFDSLAAGANRVLFVAHREEILSQAIATFRKIRPEARLGKFTGKEKDRKADVLFASVQTLGRLPHLRTFQRDEFDYIVVDEFHHAAARTYRNLINHFTPDFLLGLTATPERTDGADLLALCGGNVVFRCDLFEGIEKQLLCPFQYFGVPDTVDYRNIPWRSSKFDPEALDASVATEARAQNAYEQWSEKGGEKTLAFCCSVRHANFSAEFFRNKGIRVASVHSASNSDPRASSLKALETGEIQILFTVDMFNEGVDVPHIDTVLMLRPTESAILWTQQVGRGLRVAEGKDKLTIIDYIGNHRIFLTKPRTLLGLGSSDSDIRIALAAIRNQELTLPSGCQITYDLEALNIIEDLLRPLPSGSKILEAYYADFKERLGVRPTALETFSEGYNPKKTGRERWLAFVREMGDLDENADRVYDAHRDFLDALEITPMTKSFKILVLLAALNEGAFPGSITIEELVQSIRHIAVRSKDIRDEFGPAFDDDEAFIKLLEKNPVEAWTGGKGTGGQRYFKYENGVFGSDFSVTERDHLPLQDLAREIIEWRLAEYKSRLSIRPDEGDFECKVSHSRGNPIIFLPDREKYPSIPSGWTSVEADEKAYEANFVKIAVNVLREPGGTINLLSQLMRKWFGPDAGLPGTNFRVVFEPANEGYRLRPVNPLRSKDGAQLWKSYMREQIPGLFGFEFSTGSWNQGFVVKPGHLFLLVTLEKSDLNQEHQYTDHFISESVFAWQSQNRTAQDSTHGRLISRHKDMEHRVHLFVRNTKKISSKAAPFVNCGEVDFVSWEGEKPISVTWRLRDELPESWQRVFITDN